MRLQFLVVTEKVQWTFCDTYMIECNSSRQPGYAGTSVCWNKEPKMEIAIGRRVEKR